MDIVKQNSSAWDKKEEGAVYTKAVSKDIIDKAKLVTGVLQ